MESTRPPAIAGQGAELLVEAVRRYSKLPHLCVRSKRLAKMLDDIGLADTKKSATAMPPHVHKLAQRLTGEAVQALQGRVPDRGLTRRASAAVRPGSWLRAAVASGGRRSAQTEESDF